MTRGLRNDTNSVSVTARFPDNVEPRLERSTSGGHIDVGVGLGVGVADGVGVAVTSGVGVDVGGGVGVIVDVGLCVGREAQP